MLLNTLQCTRQPRQQRIIVPKMLVVPILRNLMLEKSHKYLIHFLIKDNTENINIKNHSCLHQSDLTTITFYLNLILGFCLRNTILLLLLLLFNPHLRIRSLILDEGGDRQKDRQDRHQCGRETSIGCFPYTPLTGDQTCHLGMCLIQESNQQCFGAQDAAAGN